MPSFTTRECRKEKLAIIIQDNFKSGDEFTVRTILNLWNQRWKRGPTEDELNRTLPDLKLYRTKVKDTWHYRYDGQDPLYIKREKDIYGNILPLGTKLIKPPGKKRGRKSKAELEQIRFMKESEQNGN